MNVLKKIYRSKLFRALLEVAFSFTLALILLASLRVILGVESPLFVVSSGSMMPTLNIGDIIVVQKVMPEQLSIGDIVVFRNPYAPYGSPIVHRIVNIRVDEKGNYKIATVGDAIGRGLDQFSPWDASLLIGRVVLRIPYIGNLYLFISTEGKILSENRSVIIVFVIIILLIAFLFFGDEGKKKAQKKVWSYTNLLYIFAINLLLICFLIFSLLGCGAHGFGMLEEYQLNAERYGAENVFLIMGFMTYRIDCQVYGRIRQGALTFSWFQFLLLVLILFNVVEVLIPFVRYRLNKEFPHKNE